MGAVTLLLAAAQEPAIKAIVSDAAFADAIPILEKRIPQEGGIPAFLTPGALLGARALYGINYYSIRPVDVVASLAPRPLFFIQGDADTSTPPSDMNLLVQAAKTGPNTQVTSWLVPGATHAHSFKVMGDEYINRLVSFLPPIFDHLQASF